MALATPPKRDLSSSLFTSSAPVASPPAIIEKHIHMRIREKLQVNIIITTIIIYTSMRIIA